MLMPKLELWPRRVHKQIGLLSTSPASSGQHGLSGTVTLLPAVTYDRQSDILNSWLKQSFDGDGPIADGPIGIAEGLKAAEEEGSGAGAWAAENETNAINNAAIINMVENDRRVPIFVKKRKLVKS